MESHLLSMFCNTIVLATRISCSSPPGNYSLQRLIFSIKTFHDALSISKEIYLNSNTLHKIKEQISRQFSHREAVKYLIAT